MTSTRSSRAWALELGLVGLVAVATLVGLWFSTIDRAERASVEALEDALGQERPVPISGAPEDLAVARDFCTGSLARQVNRLETQAPQRARAYGLGDARLTFSPAELDRGLAVAPLTLRLEGRQEDIGRALGDANAWLPSVFFDVVELAPSGVGDTVRLEAQGRVVCLAR